MDPDVLFLFLTVRKVHVSSYQHGGSKPPEDYQHYVSYAKTALTENLHLCANSWFHNQARLSVSIVTEGGFKGTCGWDSSLVLV
jgi:hypothetical protein